MDVPGHVACGKPARGDGRPIDCETLSGVSLECEQRFGGEFVLGGMRLNRQRKNNHDTVIIAGYVMHTLSSNCRCAAMLKMCTLPVSLHDAIRLHSWGHDCVGVRQYNVDKYEVMLDKPGCG